MAVRVRVRVRVRVKVRVRVRVRVRPTISMPRSLLSATTASTRWSAATLPMVTPFLPG